MKVLRNMVSVIIRIDTDHMEFYCFFHIFFGSVVFHCICGCMFCMLLFNFVCYVFFCYVYVFLLLCMFRSRFCVSLRCSVYCLCVNVCCTTVTGVNPIAVNEYIIYIYIYIYIYLHGTERGIFTFALTVS
jgi:hypothetical protein